MISRISKASKIIYAKFRIFLFLGKYISYIVCRFEFVDCVLPEYPENGKWELISGKGKPYSTITPNTLIRFSCNRGYWLDPDEEYFYCDIDWNPTKMPKCAGM